ncbi:MAG: 1,3-beta-galactosyl-N-acetylhexosamine phosphorylase [Clostridiales bacterium]|jgi:1,3-beta-galactosyl-N-acetylhexosamine phosphorylase|nr:1,3-beta-galactosyl-N-acetylhexosamine phosphorylase [Clostridiales bacterium]
MEKNDNRGGVTIPTDRDFTRQTIDIAARWGADAVRDCDGTVLPDDIKNGGYKVYSTYFVIRGDNEWGNANPDEWQHVFLTSERVLATGKTLKIDIMKGYSADQLAPDYGALSYWQVIDRTAGTVLDADMWTADAKSGVVTVQNTVPMREYAVSFMAKSLWDPVHMYNALTNGWQTEKQRMYDPLYPKTDEYAVKHMSEWLDNNPAVGVVRFTTFLYQFTLIFNDSNKEKFVDWFGYGMSVSPRMLDLFAAEYGYSLTAEDFIDGGYYATPFRVPTKRLRDYMDFVQRLVTKKAQRLVGLTHGAGKEAMMFLGDCWIGAEPYGEYFKDIGLDAVVGSVGGGVTVRMLTDIPHVKYVEGRFLPYFFPDTFFEGNQDAAVAELNRNWLTARRAMMLKPLDRIGWGGYLKLAAAFPEFINRVGEICGEFRALKANAGGGKPRRALKVAVLNAWGKIRSWQSHMVAHELSYRQIYSYQGILEILSGLPVDVKFISFDDVLSGGALADTDVVINAGGAGTAFSGGEYWAKPELVCAVREFVHGGGGFIGVGEPSAHPGGGGFFRLADVLGVDKELGFGLSTDKYNIDKVKSHFITADVSGAVDYGEGMKDIYALPGASVVDIEFSERFPKKVNAGEVKIAANDYGRGRGVYICGLPFSLQNSRLLYRALMFAAHKETEINKAFSSDPRADCHYYPDKKLYALVNNCDQTVTTIFYDKNGKPAEKILRPMEIMWIRE